MKFPMLREECLINFAFTIQLMHIALHKVLFSAKVKGVFVEKERITKFCIQLSTTVTYLIVQFYVLL